MFARKVVILLTFVLLSLALGAVSPRGARASADYPIPGGRFFTQTGQGQGGFAVLDDAQARFYSEYVRLGGAQTVGYPISRRFVHDGFVTQAFQKLVLQWRPEAGRAWPVNIFDDLSRAGYDDSLLAFRQTPRPVGPGFDPPGASWGEIVTHRQALLTTHPAIRARYFSLPDPLTVFGLPTSPVVDMGNHFAIRTQRAVFQQWKEDVPWARLGQVTIANGGDIAKELGWLPVGAATPEPGPPGEAPSTWETRTLLARSDRLYALQWDRAGRLDFRLMISDDEGASWRPFEGGLPHADACLNNLALEYSRRDALFASTCDGIYRWDGAAWRRISTEETFKLAIPYGQEQELWAIARWDNGRVPIIRSRDGGQSWEGASDGFFLTFTFAGAIDLAVDPRDNRALYAISPARDSSAGNWLHRRTPETRWEIFPRAVPVGYDLAIDGQSGDLYVDTVWGGTIQRTRNPRAIDLGEVRWESLGLVPPSPDIRLLATRNTPGALELYANIRYGSGLYQLHRTTNGGYTWSPITIR